MKFQLLFLIVIFNAYSNWVCIENVKYVKPLLKYKKDISSSLNSKRENIYKRCPECVDKIDNNIKRFNSCFNDSLVNEDLLIQWYLDNKSWNNTIKFVDGTNPKDIMNLNLNLINHENPDICVSILSAVLGRGNYNLLKYKDIIIKSLPKLEMSNKANAKEIYRIKAIVADSITKYSLLEEKVFQVLEKRNIALRDSLIKLPISDRKDTIFKLSNKIVSRNIRLLLHEPNTLEEVKLEYNSVTNNKNINKKLKIINMIFNNNCEPLYECLAMDINSPMHLNIYVKRNEYSSKSLGIYILEKFQLLYKDDNVFSVDLSHKNLGIWSDATKTYKTMENFNSWVFETFKVKVKDTIPSQVYLNID